jgi:hypothetical protein
MTGSWFEVVTDADMETLQAAELAHLSSRITSSEGPLTIDLPGFVRTVFGEQALPRGRDHERGTSRFR